MTLSTEQGLALAAVLLVVLVGVYFWSTSDPTGGSEDDDVTDPAPAATNWTCLPDLPVPVRRTAEGEIQCMSDTGGNCMWRGNMEECNQLVESRPSNLIPVECGAKHAAVWGITGYDTPEHWCQEAQARL